MVVREDVSLRPYNTFGIECVASRMVDCMSVEEVRDVAREVSGGRYYVLGGGSNVLFLRDFEGTVVRPLVGGIEVVGEDGGDVVVRVGSGVVWDEFVGWCVDRGLGGVENLSGVPGNVGAAPVQNIGAYGVEAKDVVERVWGERVGGGELVLGGGECGFGYRDSVFKHGLRGEVIVTRVDFRLHRGGESKLDYGALRGAVEALGGASLGNVRRAVLSIRGSKLPDPKVLGNAGSFFKNPEVSEEVADALGREYTGMPRYALGDGRVKIPAGWLIERSGWKGRGMGRAAVHDRQALVLVNKGGASAEEVVALCEAVRADVRSMFGIELSPEVNFVG